MQEMKLLGYEVEADLPLTRRWYARSEVWGCQCGHCRNFLEAVRKKRLPRDVTGLLDALEIPAEKATYVGQLYTDPEGVHYQFSYRIAGNIVKAPDENTEWGRCCREPYPYGAPDFPEPHFDLEFWITLPWLLEEDGGGTR